MGYRFMTFEDKMAMVKFNTTTQDAAFFSLTKGNKDKELE
jgi:hypothetical protein